MIALKIIRALFPARFQRDYGNEWESVAEDVLLDARKLGRGAFLKAWIRLVLDSMLSAPMAHASEARAAIIGKQPDLVALGPLGACAAMTRHWVARPVGAFFKLVARYSFLFVVGGFFSIIIHTGLENYATGDISAMVDRPDVFMQGPFFICSAIFLVAGVLMMGNIGKWWRKWKRTGFSFVAPAIVFSMGAVIGLYIIFISSLTQVSNDAFSTFKAFPQHQHYPSRFPQDKEYSKWSMHERYWFNPQYDSNASSATQIKPEKLEEWCTIRRATLETRKFEIQANISPSTQINTLLWNGSVAVASAEGCYSTEDMVSQRNEMAAFVVARPDLFQTTWEPLALFPIVDQLMSARYIIQGRLFSAPENTCTHIAYEMNGSGVVDLAKLWKVCQAIQTEWVSAHRQTLKAPKATLFQRATWKLGLNQTAQIKQQAAQTPKLGVDELPWLRAELEARKSEWLTEDKID